MQQSPQAVFIKRFGDLVALLRVDPGNDAAQELALAAAAHAVIALGVVVDAGVEHETLADDLTLRGRLRARRVDTLRVAAGAEPYELMMLARALSHDATPVPTTPDVTVEFVPDVVRPPEPAPHFDPPPYGVVRGAGERRRWADRRRPSAECWRGPERRRDNDRRNMGERRLRLIKHQEQDIARMMRRLTHAVAEHDWAQVLELGDRLRAYAPRVPATERRTFAIAVRRHFPRPVLDGIVQVALRNATLQPAAAGLLRWAGLDGAEVMLAAVCSSEAAAPRRFLHDALATMPEAFSLVAALLESRIWFEARHAALILGRQRRPEAVEPLKRQLAHADSRVRAGVLRALAEFPTADVVDVLRAALAHPVPDTRAAAAEAIGLQRAAALAMPLTTALSRERDPAAWSAMVQALGAIGTPDACAALAGMALERRSLLPRKGYRTEQRVEVVRVLAAVASPAAEVALERIVQQGDAPVRSAARAARAGRVAAVG